MKSFTHSKDEKKNEKNLTDFAECTRDRLLFPKPNQIMPIGKKW